MKVLWLIDTRSLWHRQVLKIAKYKEIARLMVPMLGGSCQQFHHKTVLVRLGARLSLDDRLDARENSFGPLSISDEFEIAKFYA